MSATVMEIYGRIVTTHGWAYVLTVLSPAGAAEICQVIGEPDGVMTHYRVGELPQYQEQREGALNAMIEKYQIRVLKAEDWQKKKAEISKAAFLRLPVQSLRHRINAVAKPNKNSQLLRSV